MIYSLPMEVTNKLTDTLTDFLSHYLNYYSLREDTNYVTN